MVLLRFGILEFWFCIYCHLFFLFIFPVNLSIDSISNFFLINIPESLVCYYFLFSFFYNFISFPFPLLSIHSFVILILFITQKPILWYPNLGFSGFLVSRIYILSFPVTMVLLLEFNYWVFKS